MYSPCAFFSLDINAGDRYKRLISTSPMQNLHVAASLLVDNRIHRLPLIDINETTGTEFVVSVITQFRILKFIAANV
jgi:5'-AMP-activated protein kinase, regulatory gamma subunit